MMSTAGERKAAALRTCEWKTYSGRSRRCMFHTQTSPSGSETAAGSLLYDAAQSSGNCARSGRREHCFQPWAR